MKRSRKISLLVLGTAVLLTGCSSRKPDIMQQQYSSKEDCEKDWNETEVCTRSGTGGGGYVGPRYYWNRSSSTPVALMPDGTERMMTHSALARGSTSVAHSTSVVGHSTGISRGGFGSGGHSSSGGG